MLTLSASQARAKLYRLIDEVAESGRPLRIIGKTNKAVLVSEADWQAAQVTVHLLSVAGMRESLREGMAARLEHCEQKLDG